MQKILIIAFFLLFINAVFSFDFIQVDTESQLFVDQYGRSRIFRGVNAVYKEAPYYPPITTHFHPNVSLCEEDARNLKNWGMNIVRLLVSWEGVEPTRGYYNMTYINKLKEIVAMLAKHDIYVILDFHQDLFSKRTCGNGFPTWLNEDDDGFPFPLPYKLRRDGNNFPLREDCVKHAFFQYYFAKQVNEHFQRLFDHKFSEYFMSFWELVVKEFKHFENIFGYEIVNEPWVGDIYKNPALLLSKRGDMENLNPFYKKVVPAIRKHDPDRIILYEPSTVSMAHKEVGVEPPEGKENNHKQCFSYHVYCGVVDDKGDPRWKWLCEKIDDISFSWRQKDSERIGGGRFLTEFGASSDSKKAVEQLHFIMDASDKYFLSTAYWQFKHYNDPTTQASAGTQGFYDHQGRLQVEKVQVLSRAYARAICGKPRLMRYENGNLVLVYESKDCKGQPTEIYVNEEMNYPNGYDVKVEPHIVRVVREKNLIKVYNDDFKGMVSVQVIKK